MNNKVPIQENLSDIKFQDEIWKDITGYEGFYKISSLGRVCNSISNRILSCQIRPDGYICLILRRKGDSKSCRIHRLVAEAFIPNPNNKKEVNHKNKDRADNRVENLEWNTAWENRQHQNGITTWNNHQGKISRTDHNDVRRKLVGFSNIIIPKIKTLVPL